MPMLVVLPRQMAAATPVAIHTVDLLPGLCHQTRVVVHHARMQATQTSRLAELLMPTVLYRGTRLAIRKRMAKAAGQTTTTTMALWVRDGDA